jgi:hypothetical protein
MVPKTLPLPNLQLAQKNQIVGASINVSMKKASNTPRNSGKSNLDEGFSMQNSFEALSQGVDNNEEVFGGILGENTMESEHPSFQKSVGSPSLSVYHVKQCEEN